ncbi:transcriptional regulator, GntR family [Geomicrobium sp. JCM 19037]|uniref:GntR family transcriptional regulator n=1 Tax=Geomicrobium sp. JCM 19037 TaxID=1460634 RepID=UPI00045F3CFF|nr:GntR family transcriptional regulator [Geomicrobium sp. JCM 19037]GAK03631.1 transcriptional regulator, GntR family [Geomicrobium sp. JCM 19037]
MRIEKQTISEQVVATIRKQIFLQAYEQGDALVEAELSKQLGVSRGPIREAFAKLESENLVTKRSNGRTIVNGFTEEDIRKLYDSRILLETHALSQANKNEVVEIVPRLRQCIYDMEVTTNEVEADVRFHMLIMKLSGNKTLLQLWKSLEGIFATLVDITSDVSAPNHERVVERHRVIVDAIHEYDLACAKQLLNEHLLEAMDYCTEGIEQIKETYNNGKS